jgi:hypothetical protein
MLTGIGLCFFLLFHFQKWGGPIWLMQQSTWILVVSGRDFIGPIAQDEFGPLYLRSRSPNFRPSARLGHWPRHARRHEFGDAPA